MSSPEELSPSYSWYPRDWRGSSRVRDMSWKERGFYRECLDWAWVMDGLPSDLEEIRRLCGASKNEFPKLWIAAKRMFDLTEDGRYRNERQERERLKKEIFRRRAEDGGKAKAVKEAARKQALSSASAVGQESVSSGLQRAESSVQIAESRRLPPQNGGPPLQLGLRRFKVWRWMLEDFIAVLGGHADAFDIEKWLQTLDRSEDRVIPKTWPWLREELIAEAQRRGLPLAVTADTTPTLGKLSSRMAAMVAGSRS